MVFSRLFKKKDHRHFMAAGEKHLAAGSFADARCAFQDALDRVPADAPQDREEIAARLGEAGDKLGALNLQEGERCAAAGDLKKAFEHFGLALELSHDSNLKFRAGKRMEELRAGEKRVAPQPVVEEQHAAGCSSCGGGCAPPPPGPTPNNRPATRVLSRSST